MVDTINTTNISYSFGWKDIKCGRCGVDTPVVSGGTSSSNVTFTMYCNSCQKIIHNERIKKFEYERTAKKLAQLGEG